MKKLLAISLLVGTSLFLQGCKKDDEEPNLSSQFFQQSADESGVSSENDLVFDNLNTVYQTTEAPGGGRAAAINICGATTSIVGNVVSLTFDGTTSCDGRIRNGVVTMQLIAGIRFRDINAVAQVSYNNYSVQRTIAGTSRTIVFNGTQYVKNISGGNVIDLVAGSNLVHKISGNLSAQFDGQATRRSWSVSRVRTYTKTSVDQYELTIVGDTTYNGQSGVDVIGTNRFGDRFWAITATPIKVNNTCGWGRPTQGKRAHYNDNDASLIVTFGTNISGVISGTNCPAFYKVDYSRRNRNYTAVYPY
jgi:hypothetical protein